MFGFGGGWLLVPILVLCLGVSWGYASGTVLCAIVAGASGGAAGLLLRGASEIKKLDSPTDRRITVVMVVAALVGTILGKAALRDWLAGLESATVILDAVLIIVLAVISARLIYEVVVGFERGAAWKPDPIHLAGIGLLTVVPGMLSGLIGIGGGVLYVPILVFFMRWGADEARAASRIVVLASALVGAALYALSGGVHLPTAAGMFVPAGIVGVATSTIGFSHSPRRRRAFKILSSGMALIALVLTLVHLFRGDDLARPVGTGSAEAALVAALVPLVWGVLCGLGHHVVSRQRRRRQ